jgi:hypothetical protein
MFLIGVIVGAVILGWVYEVCAEDGRRRQERYDREV